MIGGESRTRPDAGRDVSGRAPLCGSSGRGERRSRLLLNLLVLATTVGFSFVAFSHIKPGEVWRVLRASDATWIMPALAAFGLGTVARALRWRALFAVGRRPSRRATLNAMLIGYLYNSILPARAGEAARIVVLARRSPSPPVEIAGTVVLERVYDIVVVLVIFFAAQTWLPHVSWFAAAAIAAIVLAAAIACLVTLLAIFGERPLIFLLGPLVRLFRGSEERLRQVVDELTYGLSGVRHPRVALEAVIWTTGSWMLTVLCAYFVSCAFHLHLPFSASVLVVVAIGLSMILPSAPAAVGVFEGAALIALQPYGLSHSTALPYALVFHALNLVPFLVVGVVLLQYNARHPPLKHTSVGPTRFPAERAVI